MTKKNHKQKRAAVWDDRRSFDLFSMETGELSYLIFLFEEEGGHFVEGAAPGEEFVGGAGRDVGGCIVACCL